MLLDRAGSRWCLSGAMIGLGGAMLALDYRTELAAAILIVFTVVATAIFHRYWQIEDPLRRHLALSFVFNNIGIVGGLLLVT